MKGTARGPPNGTGDGSSGPILQNQTLRRRRPIGHPELYTFDWNSCQHKMREILREILAKSWELHRHRVARLSPSMPDPANRPLAPVANRTNLRPRIRTSLTSFMRFRFCERARAGNPRVALLPVHKVGHFVNAPWLSPASYGELCRCARLTHIRFVHLSTPAKTCSLRAESSRPKT